MHDFVSHTLFVIKHLKGKHFIRWRVCGVICVSLEFLDVKTFENHWFIQPYQSTCSSPQSLLIRYGVFVKAENKQDGAHLFSPVFLNKDISPN